MQKKEIVEKINNFSDWMYEFDLKGNITPVLSKSTVEGSKQRVDYFIDPLIKFCGGSLKGKKVLDIGCNSGFFALKMIEAGCDYVVGIDGRQSHIDKANFVFEVKEIDKSRYKFNCANIYDIDFKTLGQFDIVICLGFFHHINKHIELLEKISEVNTDLFLLETRVTKMPGKFVHILDDVDADHYANSINYSLTMFPSKKAVLSMASMFRYNSLIINPNKRQKAVIKNYRSNRRLAFIFAKKSNLSNFPAEAQKITFISEMKELISIFLNLALKKIKFNPK
tara:strand:- start:10051 stop:10893 length:843 start_codon:yes stop_codon:yes gene_type:complete